MQATYQTTDSTSHLHLNGMPKHQIPASVSGVEQTSQAIYLIGEDLPVSEATFGMLTALNVHFRRFRSAADYLKYGKDDEPACLIIDLVLSVDSGVDLQQRIGRETCPPIIFISNEPDIQAAVRAMKAGAISILCDPIDPAAFVAAVREALTHDRKRRLRKAEREKLTRRFSLLTPREREVLPLIIGGLLNKQAASVLGISEVTLQIHRSHVMRKMEASSIAELVRIAMHLRIPHWRADNYGSQFAMQSNCS